MVRIHAMWHLGFVFWAGLEALPIDLRLYAAPMHGDHQQWAHVPSTSPYTPASHKQQLHHTTSTPHRAVTGDAAAAKSRMARPVSNRPANGLGKSGHASNPAATTAKTIPTSNMMASKGKGSSNNNNSGSKSKTKTKGKQSNSHHDDDDNDDDKKKKPAMPKPSSSKPFESEGDENKPKVNGNSGKKKPTNGTKSKDDSRKDAKKGKHGDDDDDDQHGDAPKKKGKGGDDDRGKDKKKGKSHGDHGDGEDGDNGSDGDDSKSFEGHGTFFNPETEGGDRGACGGKKEDGSSDIVALSADKFGPTDKNSNWCGKTVLIRYGDKSTTAVIQDACPTCKSNSLDMTPSVFNKLADSSKGIIPITWCVVSDKNCK